MVNLKELTEKDRSHLASLHKQCFEKPWTQDAFYRLLENKATLAWGHWQDDCFISCLIAQCPGETADILTLACHPYYRRRKLAHDLLKKLISHLIRENCQEIFLEVKNNNLAAISLYEKNGFKKLSIRKNYYMQANGKTTDGLLMSLVLHKN